MGSSAVIVHDSQAYRKTESARERIRWILERRLMFLSLQIGWSFASTAVVCAILATISGLEPSSEMMEPRYLKVFTVSSLVPLTLISLVLPWGLFVMSLVFSALISIPNAEDA